MTKISTKIKFKTIILDFDGTIIESVGIKDQAFKELFKSYPEYFNKIMVYHFAHNATIRYEKFRYITKEILKQPYTKKIEKELSDKFSQYIFNRILKCPYITGAKDFLNYFYNKVPLYLASVNPAKELERIIEARALRKYFKKIYANPWVKKDVIRDIMAREHILHEDIVFIGDTLEDYQAAEAVGVFFIGRDGNKSFNGLDIPVYKNFSDIKAFICQKIE